MVFLLSEIFVQRPTLPRWCWLHLLRLGPRLATFVTYILIMLPNRNLRIHNAFTLGSPPPTLSCPYCPRWFYSRGGRTQHIRANHQAVGSEPPEPDPPVAPSPMPHSSHLSSQPPSPIPSDYMQPPLSGCMPPPSDDFRPSPLDIPPPSDDMRPSPPVDMPPPSCGDLDSASLDLGAEDDDLDLGYVQSEFGDELHEDAPFGAGMNDPHVPDPPRITRTYHPKLNGK